MDTVLHPFPEEGKGTILFHNSNTVHEIRFELLDDQENPTTVFEVIFTEQMVQVNPVYLGAASPPWYDEENQGGLDVEGMDMDNPSPPFQTYWFSIDLNQENGLLMAGTGAIDPHDSATQPTIIYKYLIGSMGGEGAPKALPRISWLKNTSKESYSSIISVTSVVPLLESTANQEERYGYWWRRRGRGRGRGRFGHMDHIITKEYEKFVKSTKIV